MIDAGMMLRSPESPSKQVARMSFDVGAVTSHRVSLCFHARIPIQWLAVCVFPDPRPASMRNVSYSPSSGSLWCGNASISHRTCQSAASSWALGQCRLFFAKSAKTFSCAFVSIRLKIPLPPQIRRPRQGERTVLRVFFQFLPKNGALTPDYLVFYKNSGYN